MEEILVIAEHRQGELHDITFEMLSLARRFTKDSDGRVTVLLCGSDISEFAEFLTGLSDEVLLVEDEKLANFNADPYLVCLETIIKHRKASVILVGHTATGLDLAPALAARLSIPLVTDCLDVTFTDGTLEVLRHIYGGKISARLTLKSSEHYLVSIRPGTFSMETNSEKSGQVTSLAPPEWTELKGRRFLSYHVEELEDIDITDAQILVSIGRGIGKQENIPLVQEFADTLGATLSCSRPVADKNWLPKSRQVGTSGKTVKPKIYVALGISGAFQHVVGMKNSGTIIAVNRDPQAPIFNVAHYGIVGDIFQILPKLKEKFVRS